MKIILRKQLQQVCMILALMLPMFNLSIADSSNIPGPNPMVWLQGVSQKLLHSLQKLPAADERTLQQVAQIIRTEVLPNISEDAVVRGVLASYYRKATPQQIKHFSDVFQQTLVWTYARVFKQYNGEKLHYFPLRDDWQHKQKIQINTQVQQNNRDPIAVYYRLAKTQDSWKIYDLIVEGVSVVSSYQNQLSSALSKDGIDAVIERLVAQNRNTLEQANKK